jgi:hypothetical protein
MHSLALCCVAFSALAALACPAAANDCDARRSAAAERIAKVQARLEAKLDPYEMAVITGNLRAFEEVAQWTISPWEDLLTAISQERQRLVAISCPLDGIPDANRLPPGWDTVRDLGTLHVIEIDRAITILNHQAGVARKPTAEALAK